MQNQRNYGISYDNWQMFVHTDQEVKINLILNPIAWMRYQNLLIFMTFK